MPTIITRGAGSAQGLGYASSSAPVTYIEDVFSTYLYTGNGSTQTITNGIDLSGKGGLVWIKNRAATDGAGNTANHILMDTVLNGRLRSNTSGALSAGKNITDLSNGFTVTGSELNYSADNYASWTFREQPKFFDVVTYTGDGADSRTIAHSLGSEPGFVIIKRTDSTSNWVACNFQYSGNWIFNLNSTSARIDSGSTWLTSSTNVTIWSYAFMDSANRMNLSGASYVAYFFAHNAGGFGLTGTDNVISCGSTNGSKVTLGYEPQWILYRSSNFTDDWQIVDNMRGLPVGAVAQVLKPNTSGAETTTSNSITLAADGFTLGAISGTAIYIAIRRGPMKVPTDATKVFTPIYSAAAANTVLTTSFPVDLQIPAYTGGTIGRFVVDRLRGVVTTAVDAATSPWMKTNSTDAETTGFNITRAWDNTGYQIPQYLGGATTVYFNFRRAPGFFDEVCYTGTGVARTVTHNLAAVPEMMIVRSRDNVTNWNVYTSGAAPDKRLFLETTSALNTSATVWNNTVPTSSVFSVGGSANVSTWTFVAYLFATVAGVSKVGSYTGTGTTQTINCGFTAGSRFVLIKRTDSTGDWYVWDSARGIVAGNDPHLSLNTTAAEVTTDDSVDTDSTGFVVNQVAATNVNVTSASYIFLAVS